MERCRFRQISVISNSLKRGQRDMMQRELTQRSVPLSSFGFLQQLPQPKFPAELNFRGCIQSLSKFHFFSCIRKKA